MPKFNVEVQASATIKLRRWVEAETPDQAKLKLLQLLDLIDSGRTNQDMDFSHARDASVEITEAPKLGHDFELSDIEVELDDSTLENPLQIPDHL